jgi:hypothetical protein
MKRSAKLAATSAWSRPNTATIPNRNPIKAGTLSGVLADVAAHLEISRDELARRLFE